MGSLSDLAGRRIYFATNAFAYALTGFANFEPTLRTLFNAVESGAISAATSELTLAETPDYSFPARRCRRGATLPHDAAAASSFAVAPREYRRSEVHGTAAGRVPGDGARPMPLMPPPRDWPDAMSLSDDRHLRTVAGLKNERSCPS